MICPRKEPISGRAGPDATRSEPDVKNVSWSESVPSSFDKPPAPDVDQVQGRPSSHDLFPVNGRWIKYGY